MFKAHRLCASLNARFESNKDEEEADRGRIGAVVCCAGSVQGDVRSQDFLNKPKSGTSLIGKCHPLRPYSSSMHGPLRYSSGVAIFL